MNWHVGFIDEVLTTRELIDKIVGEAEEILASGGLGGWRLVSE